ncbi:DUF6614 family protein [Tropicibacter naphthalenivorans]|uniref:Uncharacterized protein n=1 Tax=Tropicibacter naphthalenivorans TaxID=441103 RepID=A0A0P1G7M1_9RHOB|nr:DUF6614 family protein [Tropicibacter naphthalenivorans]CUH77668.1 hypothetical protein TRN7648_01598 [Tropicibacter naphthalenivorans]SMC54448.1 hypothetical protein SAMN04488093_10219 [Tropicibacter naphthalenivorans]
MNLYTCSIDLKNDAKALVFAKAAEDWLNHLKSLKVIQDWHLYRRKLNLASSHHRDFLLQIEVEDMSQLDQAFRTLGRHDDTIDALYRAVHEQILAADFGLYRPFPDTERAERMALL